MAEKPFPTPILKRTDRLVGNSPITRRRSVTFRDDNQTSSIDVERSPKKSSSKQSSANFNHVLSFSRGSKIQLTDFGLCYTPGNEPTQQLGLPHEAIHPQTAKIIPKEHCLRPELLRSTSRVDQYNIVMLGDVIHGKCLKTQLEDYPELSFNVSLFAFPTKGNIRMADFFLILLPLEVIGSCSKAETILQRMLSLRADGSLRCAAVGVSSSSGNQHVTELLNIHTLLLQHSLSYYIWSDASPGTWPGIVRRLAAEVVSCGEGRSALPRPALCSLLWPSDSPSFMLQQYIDQTAHRTGLDLNYE